MDAINNGGPAFPVSTRETDIPLQGAYGHQDGHNTWQFSGMTLRDYFAAKAMAGICSHRDTWGCGIEEIGIKAYEVADTMLAARDA